MAKKGPGTNEKKENAKKDKSNHWQGESDWLIQSLKTVIPYNHHQTERVPFVRHDLYFEEWEAIGKILCKGFLDAAYFLIQLSQGFLIYIFCLEQFLMAK